MKRHTNPTTNDLFSTLEWFFNDSLESFSPLFRETRRILSSASTAANPVNWYEDDENFYALVDLPGVKKDALDLEVEDGLLRLSFSRLSGNPAGDKTETTLRIPEDIDTTAIEAGLEDGVLTVVLPKSEERKPVSVKVS